MMLDQLCCRVCNGAALMQAAHLITTCLAFCLPALPADTLWVEKYKPHNAAELVGNNTNVATLRQWLHQWEDVHLRGAVPQQPRHVVSKLFRHTRLLPLLLLSCGRALAVGNT